MQSIRATVKDIPFMTFSSCIIVKAVLKSINTVLLTSHTGNRLLSILVFCCRHSCLKASRSDSSIESNSDFKACCKKQTLVNS